MPCILLVMLALVLFMPTQSDSSSRLDLDMGMSEEERMQHFLEVKQASDDEFTAKANESERNFIDTAEKMSGVTIPEEYRTNSQDAIAYIGSNIGKQDSLDSCVASWDTDIRILSNNINAALATDNVASLTSLAAKCNSYLEILQEDIDFYGEDARLIGQRDALNALLDLCK